MSNRVEWVDFAKGFTISLVVIHHAIEGINNVGLLPFWVGEIHQLFSPVMMPLFFFVAGIFSLKSIEQGWKAFFEDKVSYLVYMYIVWSFIIFSFRYLLSDFSNHKVLWYEIFMIPFDALPTIWFVYCLLLCFFITKCFLFLGLEKIIFISTCLFVCHFSGVEFYFFTIINEFMFVWLYFVIGLAFRHLVFSLLDRSNFYCFLFFFVMFISVGSVSIKYDWVDFAHVYFILSLSAIASILIMAFLMQNTLFSKAVSFLGKSSLYIYLCHFLPVAACRFFLVKLGVDSWVLILGVCYATAIVFSLIVGWLSKDRLALFEKPYSFSLRWS